MPRRAFTLIELLIVVAIIAILAAIAVPNLSLATERARQSADAANMKVVAGALQGYLTDYNSLPPADREAGPFQSHTREFMQIGNGPAAGGSWDAVPWLLVDLGYVSDPQMLFTNKYRKLFAGGESLSGGHARYHNFRYAYNAAALSSGGLSGGTGIESGGEWMLRNLYLPAAEGFYGNAAPDYPADYRFPWGEGKWEGWLEHAVFADFAVRRVIGGMDRAPRGDETPESLGLE